VPGIAVTPEQALERVRNAVGTQARDLRLNFGQVDMVCSPDAWVEVATKLRDEPDLRCRFFTFLSAVDRSEFGEDKGGDRPLEVLVHLFSPEHVLHVNVHVPVDPANPSCPTITGVFAGANWHERECNEMYGIDFPGHEHLVNLYLPEDFDGHPGLKAFKLPSRFVKNWPGAKDPEEAAAGGR
jgi:NADH:ubiquinone oxidoreductase subunit C